MEGIETRALSRAASSQIQALVDDLAAEFRTASHPDFLAQAPALASGLGSEISGICGPSSTPTGAFVLRGLEVPEDRLGPTPGHWSSVDPCRTVAWDMAVVLLAALIGRPFGWRGQQAGRIVHHVVPTRGREHEQTGASSATELTFHTEDAFHPARAQVVLLGCLRNPDRVATRVASIRDADLDPEDEEVLRVPGVQILPDASYVAEDSVASVDEAPPVTTVWRRADGACLRFDPAYSRLPSGDGRYQRAYRCLDQRLRDATAAPRLGPGDVAVLDNDVVVHGREPFAARYDGTDRWLTRVSVRVEGRFRPPDEAREHGYGQVVVDGHSDREGGGLDG